MLLPLPALGMLEPRELLALKAVFKAMQPSPWRVQGVACPWYLLLKPGPASPLQHQPPPAQHRQQEQVKGAFSLEHRRMGLLGQVAVNWH